MKFLRFFFVALATSFITILTYEATKKWAFPHLTMLESHILFVAAISVLFTVLTYIIFRKYSDLRIKIDYTKQALDRAEKDFQNLFSEDLTGNLILDLKGNIINVNESFVRIFGYDNKEELLGQKISIVHPDDSEYDFIINELKKNGCLKNYETVRKRKDGQLINIIENVIVKRNADGAADRIEGYIFDITNRVQAEKRIQESEERWKFALEGSQAGLWEWNLETDEVFFSSHWKAMLGYEDHEISNRLEEWSNRVHPEDLQKCYQDVELHLSGKVSFYSNIHRVLCKDGSYKWILDKGKITKFNGDKPVRMTGTHTDLTQRMEMESRLRDLNATKDKLFSLIAHDLRNPIGNILSFSDLLKRECNSVINPKGAEFINVINSSAERTLILLEDLLLWAKTQTGQIEFNPEMVNVNIIFTEIFEILNPNAKLKEIRIKNYCPDELFCYADKQMLKTIFRNLLQNAIKFTSSGGLVEFFASAEGGNVRFTVSDTGIGMDSGILNKLFKIGEDVSNFGTSGEKGSGLGLNLCSEFIEKHGGKIWVESQIGEGSRFHFTMPISGSVLRELP